jgi:hypothetical protein
MLLAQQIPVAAIDRLVNEEDTKLWRLIAPVVEEAHTPPAIRILGSSVASLNFKQSNHPRGHSGSSQGGSCHGNGQDVAGGVRLDESEIHLYRLGFNALKSSRDVPPENLLKRRSVFDYTASLESRTPGVSSRKSRRSPTAHYRQGSDL